MTKKEKKYLFGDVLRTLTALSILVQSGITNPPFHLFHQTFYNLFSQFLPRHLLISAQFVRVHPSHITKNCLLFFYLFIVSGRFDRQTFLVRAPHPDLRERRSHSRNLLFQLIKQDLLLTSTFTPWSLLKSFHTESKFVG